jgi:ABC-type transport system involved in cytochrome bd biosynthesis fused ATPase/permease subunit
MRLRGTVTMLAISHQPALVQVADQIYRIEEQTIRGQLPGSAQASAA